MPSDREATSEYSSSIYEGADYNEVYSSRREPLEYLTWSPKSKLSAYSFAEGEDKEYVGDEEEGEDKDDDEEDGEGEEEGNGDVGENHWEGDGAVSEVTGSCHKPFILPLIWTMNNFYPTMSLKVLNNLLNHYQTPKHIPMRLPRKFEKCYLGRTVDIGMYDAMFTVSVRLPLTKLHRQLANYLGLSVGQIPPNAWRIFIGTKVIWGQLSGGNHCLTPNEFFYYSRP